MAQAEGIPLLGDVAAMGKVLHISTNPQQSFPTPTAAASRSPFTKSRGDTNAAHRPSSSLRDRRFRRGGRYHRPETGRMKCAGASERYIMPRPKTGTRRKVKFIFITSWEGNTQPQAFRRISTLTQPAPGWQPDR